MITNNKKFYQKTLYFLKENEDASSFASRVKSEIVKKGSFVDLNWDGMLKRTAPKLDLMYEQQQKYFSQLKID